MAELASSELASGEERTLAEVLLTEEARFDPHGTDLRLIGGGPELDDADFVEDDDTDMSKHATRATTKVVTVSRDQDPPGGCADCEAGVVSSLVVG